MIGSRIAHALMLNIGGGIKMNIAAPTAQVTWGLISMQATAVIVYIVETMGLVAEPIPAPIAIAAAGLIAAGLQYKLGPPTK